MLLDSVPGAPLAASSGEAKRAFSFLLPWSEERERRIKNPRARPPRRTIARTHQPGCTDSVPYTSSTDYLVISGRASARPMYAANVTLESPLDSSAHHRSTSLLTQYSPTQSCELSVIPPCPNPIAGCRALTSAVPRGGLLCLAQGDLCSSPAVDALEFKSTDHTRVGCL
jgi:hypothetical protein